MAAAEQRDARRAHGHAQRQQIHESADSSWPRGAEGVDGPYVGSGVFLGAGNGDGFLTVNSLKATGSRIQRNFVVCE